MRRQLRFDPETCELRLVLTDYYRGQHERLEYRLIDSDGSVLRGHRVSYWDGRRVGWDHSRHFVEAERSWEQRVYFDSELLPVVSEKTACPAYRNLRKACALCVELGS